MLPHKDIIGRDDAKWIHNEPDNYGVDPPGLEIPGVEIPVLNNPTEETDTNVMPVNLPGPTPTNDKNTPKVKKPKSVPTQYDPNDFMTINGGDGTNE